MARINVPERALDVRVREIARMRVARINPR